MNTKTGKAWKAILYTIMSFYCLSILLDRNPLFKATGWWYFVYGALTAYMLENAYEEVRCMK